MRKACIEKFEQLPSHATAVCVAAGLAQALFAALTARGMRRRLRAVHTGTDPESECVMIGEANYTVPE